jgi:hypothetical protein
LAATGKSSPSREKAGAPRRMQLKIQARASSGTGTNGSTSSVTSPASMVCRPFSPSWRAMWG